MGESEDMEDVLVAAEAALARGAEKADAMAEFMAVSDRVVTVLRAIVALSPEETTPLAGLFEDFAAALERVRRE